jgi:hypothetical protein
MLVNVDISVFSSPTTAFANVWGEIDLPVVPSARDEMSFLFTENGTMPPTVPSAGIYVTGRRIDVGRTPSCSIQISDIVAEDELAAEAICNYFERGFGLHVDRYAIHDP